MYIPSTAADVMPGETLVSNLGDTVLVTGWFQDKAGRVHLQVLARVTGEVFELNWDLEPTYPFTVLVGEQVG